MIKISITGKADKRILTYPLMRACSIAGRTCVVTNDPAYKRLYTGIENKGAIEGIKIIVLPDMTPENMLLIEEKAQKSDIEFFIIVSDANYLDGVDQMLMVCERNTTFLGDSMEELIEDHENITFSTISLNKMKTIISKGINIHQIIWKPEHALYLYQVEELRQLLPLKDKYVSACLVDAFTAALNLKPEAFYELLKRKRYSFTKKGN